MNQKQIDSLFSNIDDEYDLIAQVGKAMSNHNISIDMKDAIKTIIREAVNFGYNLGIKDSKK